MFCCCFQETEVEVLITSHELLPKFRQILTAKTDKIRTIIYMENPIQRTDLSGYRQEHPLPPPPSISVPKLGVLWLDTGICRNVGTVPSGYCILYIEEVTVL
jgi:hypothetical protein